MHRPRITSSHNKNTKNGKHTQKRDIENISEEYKEAVRQKLAKINPQGKDSENLWLEIQKLEGNLVEVRKLNAEIQRRTRQDKEKYYSKK